MPRACIVINRRARGLVAEGPLLRALRRPGFDVYETRSLAELDSVARELREGPSDIVVLAGGDGSYMAGVSALHNAHIHFAFAPGGTVGTVARNWGMHGNHVRSATRLLDVIAEGSFTTMTRPTLRVGDRLGFIFGAGLVARFFDLYESRGARGNLDAARIAARVFAGSFVGSRFARNILEPQPCAIDVDGGRAPFDHVSLACASVVRNLGLGLRLTYRAGEALDRFHFVATPLEPRALGPQMPRVLAARPLRGPRIDTLAREVRLTLGAYVLDGDLFRADSVTVTAGPPIQVIGV